MFVGRPTDSPKNVSQQSSKAEELWDELSQEEDGLYSASPPCTPRQMKRMSDKRLRSNQNRSVGRSPVKGKMPFFNFTKEIRQKDLLTIGST